jgi:mono/diheme cytochrome c family protein
VPIKNSTELVLALLLVLALAGTPLVAQTGGSAQVKQTKELKTVPMAYSDPSSSAQMYKDYCAACHGKEGKGDGPAVEFLKTPPPDLRTLAQRNNGKYPARPGWDDAAVRDWQPRARDNRHAALGAAVPHA